MGMKISTDNFKDRVNQGIHNDFMRGAVAGAQDGMGIKRRNEARTNLEIGKSGDHMARKSASMFSKILITI